MCFLNAKEKPVLSIVVVTYNQERYIAQTLESILGQDIPVGFEVIVGDDCSADSTAEILLSYQERYPNVLKVVKNPKNMGVVKNYFNVISQCSGDYIMECAGDDYWLPNKARSQLQYMRDHPDCDMSYARVKMFSEESRDYLPTTWGGPFDGIDDLIHNTGLIPPVTMCFTRAAVIAYLAEIDPLSKSWLAEDYPFYLWLAQNRTIDFIDAFTAVYRVLPESIAHSKSRLKQLRFLLSVIEMQIYFCEKYHLGIERYIDGLLRNYIAESYALRNREICLRSRKLIMSETAFDRAFDFFIKNGFIFSVTSFFYPVYYHTLRRVLRKIIRVLNNTVRRSKDRP